MHVIAPPRDAIWARRFRDIYDQIVVDLGGAGTLSEAQQQLARRCATICIACERLEGDIAAGREVNLDLFGTLTDRLGRTFQRIGVKRQAKDITPSVAWAVSDLYYENSQLRA